MVTALVKPGRALAKRLLLLQSGAVLAAAMLAMLTVDLDWGFSALIGGGIFVISNTVFSLCAFLVSGARQAKLVMALFYGGEVLKILLTALLFSAVYLYVEVEFTPLILTYLLALMINFSAPVLFINSNK